MRRTRVLAAVMAAVLLLLTAGCGGASEKSAERTVFAMDTVMTLKVYGAKAEKAADEAAKEIRELEALLSVTSEGSEIWAVNHAGGAAVKLSDRTAELLLQALAFCGSAGGVLDISVYPVLKAWGFTTGTYRVPSRAELDALLERVDYTRISFDEASAAVTLPAGMEIDLGCIAKGYTGDRLAELLRSRGIGSALINLGGNVQTLGSKPDGSLWRIGVQDPEGSGYIGVLESRDEAVITSGGYERFFEEGGEIYWHIIDPATGAPARSGVISATVVSPSGTRCDALSTALFIMGREAAAEYWRARGDFEFILVLTDGTVVVSEGLADRFSLAGDWADHPLEIEYRDS